ncbi:uncharacterized protein LOC105840166 isoform X2 [Monomorium pharaonis]|nr:uncharacterized protein LOC105840166 isoform X2 [Monomorium pharaonis]
MCTSLSNEGCSYDMTTTSLQPVECTGNKIDEWQRSIQQHNVLKSVAHIFAIDVMGHNYPRGTPMVCAKVILNIAKQDVIVRTCQTTKTEHIDSCKKMEEKLKDDLSNRMQCALCNRDACNSTMFLSPEIFYIFLSFFCTLFTFYR